MSPSRRNFIMASAAASAVAAAGSPSAASPAAAADSVRGLTFTTYRDAGADRLGLRVPAGVVDVLSAADLLGVPSPPSSIDDVLNGRGYLPGLVHIAARPPREAVRKESSLEYAPLVSAPQKIICVGLNYRAHLAETNTAAPAYPDLFNKYNTALNRHNGTVPVSGLPLSHFDYESELVMVIGKTARNVSEADALDAVFGYACGHDFTARDAQLRVSQWMTGKTPDLFAPLGPWLVGADQIHDPQALQIQTFVNDETVPRQDMSTSQMIFSCATIVSYISQYMTLQPGDVIFTGTPSGTIVGYPPEKRVWLKPGDRIRTVISQVGELRFRLV